MRRTDIARPAVLALSLAVAAVGLVGCGDEETELKIAQARVASAERDVARAQATFDSASQQFCDSTKDYVVAIDRYGDVLNATATTVGDVKTAGKDLKAPRGDVRAEADEAIEAHEELVEAQGELADAQAALVQAQGGTTEAPAPTESAEPESEGEGEDSHGGDLLPEATVDRVIVAEQQLDAAQGAATDQTPLAQASQQFNAAAVALELAWLDVFADAGCVDEDTVHAQEAVAAYTAALQQALDAGGYYDGEIDGVYGPETVAAVEAVQKAHGLPVTGALDKATAAALQGDLLSKGGIIAQQALANTAAVQQTLKLVGYWDGPVDGIWSPELTEAIKDFQKALGVEPTGVIDAATVQAFEEAIAEAMEPEPTPTPTPKPTPEPTPSASPTPEPSPVPSEPPAE